jgi:hypothetical protein
MIVLNTVLYHVILYHRVTELGTILPPLVAAQELRVKEWKEV